MVDIRAAMQLGFVAKGGINAQTKLLFDQRIAEMKSKMGIMSLFF